MPIPSWYYDRYVKLDLFDKKDRKLNHGLVKVVIGQFYEVVASNMLQGEHYAPSAGMNVHPDVVIWNNKKNRYDTVIEVKATYKDFIIDIGQMNYYKELLNSNFPFHKPKAYYCLFMHNLKDIEKTYKTFNSLITALSKNTLSCIYTPLEFIHKLVAMCKKNEYKGWGTGSRGMPNHEYYIRLGYGRIKKWSLGDVKIFKETINFDISKYKFVKRNVNIKIMDMHINKFPIIKII